MSVKYTQKLNPKLFFEISRKHSKNVTNKAVSMISTSQILVNCPCFSTREPSVWGENPSMSGGGYSHNKFHWLKQKLTFDILVLYFAAF